MVAESAHAATVLQIERDQLRYGGRLTVEGIVESLSHIGAKRNLLTALRRRRFLAIVLPLHRLGELLHYTP